MKSRDLKDPELTLILDNMLSLRDRALFIVGVKTGFRISELLSLRYEDVVHNGTIRDSITVRRCNMKGHRQSRTVVLHQDAKEALRAYLQIGTQIVVCVSPAAEILKGGSVKKWQPKDKIFQMTRQHAHRIISGAAEKAGLSGTISTHSMRKTFGMNVYIRTQRNVVAAQKALGHSSLASTSHYLSIGQDEVDAAILA